jgi:hypothetical protein
MARGRATGSLRRHAPSSSRKSNRWKTRTAPFANLPEKKTGRWGAGLTAAKMADCRWLTPVLVGQFEYVEWTADTHLRLPQTPPKKLGGIAGYQRNPLRLRRVDGHRCR